MHRKNIRSTTGALKGQDRPVLLYTLLLWNTCLKSTGVFEEHLGVFTAVNLTFTSLHTVLYQSTPGEQNCFVWPAFQLSLYLQPFTVAGLFQQGLAYSRPGTEPFSVLCAWFVRCLGTLFFCLSESELESKSQKSQWTQYVVWFEVWLWASEQIFIRKSINLVNHEIQPWVVFIKLRLKASSFEVDSNITFSYRTPTFQ